MTKEEKSTLRKFKIYKDYLGVGCDIYKKATITLKPGVTILAGCNGMGKTTLIRQLIDKLKSQNAHILSFDNLHDGGQNARSWAGFRGDFSFLATSAFSSEGENIQMNLGNFAGRIGDFCRFNRDSEDLWIFMDSIDSGLSIDNVVEVKDMCKQIIEICGRNRSVYIIISANLYEFARDEDCFDVYRGKYIRFKSYEKYREFILKTRQEKDNRVYDDE